MACRRPREPAQPSAGKRCRLSAEEAGSGRHGTALSREHRRAKTDRRDLFACIEGRYNPRRIPSAIGGLTPQQAEAKAA
jgi:transposase InsO family protein